MRNVRVFEVDVGGAILSVFGSLRRQAVTRRSETAMARRFREKLRDMLTQIVLDAQADGSFPIRTGRAFNITRTGARAFGQTFNSMRGHIIGPDYLLKQEEGGTIRPRSARALTIPLAAALRPDGTPKLPGPRSWQNVRDTFIYTSRRTKRSYIAYEGQGGRLVLLYVLVDSVTFEAKEFLANAWDKRRSQLMAEFGEIMLAELSQIDLLALARVTHSGKGRSV